MRRSTALAIVMVLLLGGCRGPASLTTSSTGRSPEAATTTPADDTLA